MALGRFGSQQPRAWPRHQVQLGGRREQRRGQHDAGPLVPGPSGVLQPLRRAFGMRGVDFYQRQPRVLAEELRAVQGPMALGWLGNQRQAGWAVSFCTMTSSSQVAGPSHGLTRPFYSGPRVHASLCNLTGMACRQPPGHALPGRRLELSMRFMPARRQQRAILAQYSACVCRLPWPSAMRYRGRTFRR